MPKGKIVDLVTIRKKLEREMRNEEYTYNKCYTLKKLLIELDYYNIDIENVEVVFCAAKPYHQLSHEVEYKYYCNKYRKDELHILMKPAALPDHLQKYFDDMEREKKLQIARTNKVLKHFDGLRVPIICISDRKILTVRNAYKFFRSKDRYYEIGGLVRPWIYEGVINVIGFPGEDKFIEHYGNNRRSKWFIYNVHGDKEVYEMELEPAFINIMAEMSKDLNTRKFHIFIQKGKVEYIVPHLKNV